MNLPVLLDDLYHLIQLFVGMLNNIYLTTIIRKETAYTTWNHYLSILARNLHGRHLLIDLLSHEFGAYISRKNS